METKAHIATHNTLSKISYLIYQVTKP